MAKKIKKIGDKIVNGGGLFVYMRSVMTSQLSAWTDFIVSFVVFAIINASIDHPDSATSRYIAGLSACLGAIAGGIVNCLVNYKFTFKVTEGSIVAIGVKFFMVWLGSLLLNTFGTEYLNGVVQRSDIMDYFGASRDIRFAVARVSTAILVSVFWNFLLQQYFVFRINRIDPYIDSTYRRLRIDRRLRARHHSSDPKSQIPNPKTR